MAERPAEPDTRHGREYSGFPFLVSPPASLPASSGNPSAPPFSTNEFAFATRSLAPPISQVQLLRALLTVSNEMNSAHSAEQAAHSLASHTVQLLGTTAVLIHRLDEGGWVHALASFGTMVAPPFLPDAPLTDSRISRTLIGTALRENRPYTSWNESTDSGKISETLFRDAGYACAACAVMYAGKRAVGTLTVLCVEDLVFSDEEIYILSLLAAQGGVALQNVQNQHTLREQSEDMRFHLNQVGEALSASLDLGEVLHLIVQLSVEMTPATAGAVYLLPHEYSGTGARLAGMFGLDRRSVRRFRAEPLPFTAQTSLRERRAVVVPDTRRVARTPFPRLRLQDDSVAETRSVLCVPLFAGEHPIGVLEQYSPYIGVFQQMDVDNLTRFACQAAAAIERSRLFAQESHLAETFQRAFLPELPRTIPGFEIGRIYSPGNAEVAVGGDTYDLFALPDGRVALDIADVTGSGTTAAKLSVMAKYTIRAYAYENPDPASVIARFNDAACFQTDDQTFITLLYALIHPVSRQVEMTSAGHPAPVWYRAATSECLPVEQGAGMIAGCWQGQHYSQASFVLSPGDVLLFYTDGVIEARQDKELFGMERLVRVVRENGYRGPQEIAAEVFSAVSQFTDGIRSDDLAILALKVG